MIRIKRQKKLMIVALIVISVVTLYISLIMINKYGKKNEYTNQVSDTQAPVSKEKTEELERFAIEIVDQYSIENHAMVVVESGLIANDQYKRYLVQVETVAINQQVGNGLYTYYIVIQENKEGKFYVPPFGVEILKNTRDPLKREIIISMMKVINGWGDTTEEFEKRWGKILGNTEELKNKAGIEKKNTKLEGIYFIQSILKYMIHYLEHYSEAIEYNDLVCVKDFLREVPGFYEEQYREIELLENEGIQREVLEAEIIEIIPESTLKSCIVRTKLDIRTHIGSEFLDLVDITDYKVKIVEGVIKIIEVVQCNNE